MNNIECDNRRDYHDCEDFTLFKIYAHAAKVPPSGAGVSLINILLLFHVILILYHVCLPRGISPMNLSLPVAKLSPLKMLVLDGQH